MRKFLAFMALAGVVAFGPMVVDGAKELKGVATVFLQTDTAPEDSTLDIEAIAANTNGYPALTWEVGTWDGSATFTFTQPSGSTFAFTSPADTLISFKIKSDRIGNPRVSSIAIDRADSTSFAYFIGFYDKR